MSLLHISIYVFLLILLILSLILFFRQDTTRYQDLRTHHKKRVEKQYVKLFKGLMSKTPDALGRFHFGNHLANIAALWLTVLGLIVPVSSQGFTFGPFWAVPFVVFLDGFSNASACLTVSLFCEIASASCSDFVVSRPDRIFACPFSKDP